MTVSRSFISAASGEVFDPSSGIWQCPTTGAHLNLAQGDGLKRSDVNRQERSMWRYGAAIAISPSVPLTLGVGWTPLIQTTWSSGDVGWKLDFMNPSGSFKDRGFAVVINYLRELGIASVSEDSSGNGGAALATFAASAGMRCRIYVPAATSAAKIAQISATGAEVIRIAGARQAVAEAAIEDDTGSYYASHNWHPMFVEGTKTVGYEIWEQMGHRAPDVIVAPTGGGSNVIGCRLAFDELLRAREIDRLPRLFGIQSMACDPLAKAFASSLSEYHVMQPSKTIAEGIAVSQPVRSREVLAAARDSGGGVIAVSESEIFDAYQRLARIGIYVEPTSATAATGVDVLRRDGHISATESVVVILTGSGLKSGTVEKPT